MMIVMRKCLIAGFLAAIFSVVIASRLTMDLMDAQISLDEFETLMETQYGKKYSSVQEAELRHAIFKANLAHITDHNALFLAGGHSYWLGLNKFIDMTNLEFRMLKNNYKHSGPTEAKYTHTRVLMEKLPGYVDWREKGVVSEVKDQGQCGSCWSFSATGSMEGAHALATGNLTELSEQQLIDCVDRGRDNCAHGGEMQHAFRYVIKHGSEREEDYPYSATSGNQCRYSNYRPAAQFSGFANVTQYDEQALTSAIANFPTVSVAIDASAREFQFYAGGVYNNPKCLWKVDDLDHGVLAVGYGTTESGEDYYLVKNSWGADWGEAGYIKMSRNRNNQCGIATDASFVRV